jgi:hypothetical protein
MMFQQLDRRADIGLFDIHPLQLQQHEFLHIAATGPVRLELPDQLKRSFQLLRFDPGLFLEADLRSQLVEILLQEPVLVQRVDEEVKDKMFVFRHVQEPALPLELFPEIWDLRNWLFGNLFRIDIIVVLRFIIRYIVIAIFVPILKILHHFFVVFVGIGIVSRG